MEFNSKLFCFIATMIMFVVVAMVELAHHRPAPPSMIGFHQPNLEHWNNDNDDQAFTTDEYEFEENSFGTTGTANFMHNRQQALLIMMDLDTRCKRLIDLDEKQCFRNYFETYGKMDEPVFTEDIKSDFNRKACCCIWRWYDCTRSRIQEECDEMNLRKFETKLVESYIYTTYCVNYEYGSDACVPFTVWMLIGFATLGTMVLAGTCLAVFMVVRQLRLKQEERERRSGQNYEEPVEELEL